MSTTFRIKEEESNTVTVYLEQQGDAVYVMAQNDANQISKLMSFEGGILYLEKMEEWACDIFDNEEGYMKVLE